MPRAVRRLVKNLDSKDKSWDDVSRGHGGFLSETEIDGSCEALRPGDLIKCDPPSRWEAVVSDRVRR